MTAVDETSLIPGPGHQDPARALAAYLAAEGMRRDAQCEASGGWRSPDDQAAAHLALAAVHALRALIRADPGFADRAAREVCAIWRDGDLPEAFWVHCEAAGLDPAEVRRLAVAEMAVPGPEPDADGTKEAPAADGTPGAPQAVPEPDGAGALRAQVEHLSAALAGDNEGVRLWMLDCGRLTDKHRRHAAEVSVKLGKIRELAEEEKYGEPGEWGLGRAALAIDILEVIGSEPAAGPADARDTAPVRAFLLAEAGDAEAVRDAVAAMSLPVLEAVQRASRIVNTTCVDRLTGRTA